MKKVVFLLFTCLMLVALVIPAYSCTCDNGGDKGAVIKVGVIGPMQFMQGKQHWLGAVMAAEEINGAGGIKVGDVYYKIKLIQSDSNETLSITDASAAMEKLITVDGADFVMGGFRTEGVTPMQEVAMDNKTIFLGCGAATATLNSVVKSNYDRYKYWFRVTPFVSAKLVDNTLMEIAMAGAIIKEETGIPRKLRVAICAEGAQWADGMVGMMKAWIPGKLKMEVSGTWRPSPNATELNAEMAAIQAANTDIICPIISGAVGIPYGRSWGELKVPAASVGINVEAQSLGYWAATNHFGNWDTGLASYSKNMEPTEKTKPFFDAFVARYEDGDVPSYTAGTYDAMYILKDAIERAGTFTDPDAIVVELEKTSTTTCVAPHFTFTGMDAELGNPHDVNYGPGASTGIACQWQDGELLGVWPNDAYGQAYVDAGFAEGWKNTNIKGVAKWMIPPVLLEKIQGEVGVLPPVEEQPAAEQPAKEEPAAATGGGNLSVPSTIYTNDTYGFTVEYPSEWVERPDMLTTPLHVAAFTVSAFVPGLVMIAFDNDGPEDVAWIKSSVIKIKGDMPKVMGDITPVKLADGSQAYTYKIGYVSSSGYEAEGLVKDVDRGAKRIRFMAFTVTSFEPFNQKLYEEILNTVTFK